MERSKRVEIAFDVRQACPIVCKVGSTGRSEAQAACVASDTVFPALSHRLFLRLYAKKKVRRFTGLYQ
jgi:hypothetical protein